MGLNRFYHVTLAANLESIRRDGLLPVIGARSAKMGETSSAIYFFTSPEAVEDGLTNWLGCELNDEELAVLTVELPEDLPDNHFELAIDRRIGPDMIIDIQSEERFFGAAGAAPEI